MTNRKTTALRSIALAMFLLGLIILGFFWKALGERGINADKTGTSGYTNAPEAALIIAGILLVTVSVALLIIFRSKKH